MNKARIHIIVIFFMTGFVIFYASKFFMSLDNLFYQRHYVWEQEKPVDSIQQVKVLGLNKSNLRLLINNPKNLNRSFTYKLISPSLDTFYFRYEYPVRRGKEVKFFGVEWLKGMPKKINGIFQFQASLIPLKKKHGKTAVTFGNGILSKTNSKYLRKELRETANLNFLGQYYDVFNLAYEASSYWGIKDLIYASKNIPKADYYFVFISEPKNNKISFNNYLKQIPEIVRNLESRNPDKIIWIEIQNKRSYIIKEVLNKLAYKNIWVITQEVNIEDDIGMNFYQQVAQKIKKIIND